MNSARPSKAANLKYHLFSPFPCLKQQQQQQNTQKMSHTYIAFLSLESKGKQQKKQLTILGLITKGITNYVHTF